MVVGHTRSTVTRKPLVGVEVKGADPRSPPPASRTPDDDGTPDGLYWLFTPGAGRQRLTATLAAHTDAGTRVQVAGSQTVRQDLGLQSGRLEPVPRSLTVEVRAGKVAQRRMTLANTGDASLRYDLEEVPGRPVTATGAGDEWERITPYPSPVSDSAAGVLDGTIYSFGGVGYGERARADGYRYDEAAQKWVRLADLPIAHRKPAGGFVDGRFVVTGGWGPDDKLTDATSIYDPETDTWSEGAANPQPWAAAGSAVLEGRAVRRGRLRRERRLRPHGRAPLRPGGRRVDPGWPTIPSQSLGSRAAPSVTASTAPAASARRVTGWPRTPMTPAATSGHPSPTCRSTCGAARPRSPAIDW